MQGTKLSPQFQKLIDFHKDPVYSVKFDHTGQYIMTASADRGVCLYNPQKNIMIKNYKNLHNYDIFAITINKDSSKFITGGGDKNVIVTDVVEGKTINKFMGHNGPINSVALNASNNVIISGSYDTTVRCWDNRANSYTPIDIIKGFKDSVTHVEINGFQIVCGSMDGTVRFYDIRTGQYIIDQIGQAIQSMCVAQSNRAYVISGLDNILYLVDKKSGNKVMEYKGHLVKNYTINCKFNEEDTHILSGSADGSLYIYDIMKSEPVKVINISEGPLSCLDLHPKGGLICGSHKGSIYYSKF